MDIDAKYLDLKLSHDECIEFTIQTTKLTSLTRSNENIDFGNQKFEQLLDYASQSLKIIMKSLEQDHEFFEPCLVFDQQGIIKVRLMIRRKDEKK